MLSHPVVTLAPWSSDWSSGSPSASPWGWPGTWRGLARTAGAARLAEGRLADAQAASRRAGGPARTASDGGRRRPRRPGPSPRPSSTCSSTSEAESARRAAEDRDRLAGAFAELSAQALAKNNEQFLALADSRLSEARTPPKATSRSASRRSRSCSTRCSATLARYEAGLRDMEMERKGAYATLSEKVADLHLGHEQLQKETRNLVTALRSPQTRGRWGEMQLRQAVEMAGMLEHCDFEEQRSTPTAEACCGPT